MNKVRCFEKQCKFCKKYDGDCGFHFEDENGNINLEIPSETMSMNGTPCFEAKTIKDEKKRLSAQLEQIAEEFCNNYCKYPDIWDEEKEGCELSESDICANCPMSKI